MNQSVVNSIVGRMLGFGILTVAMTHAAQAECSGPEQVTLWTYTDSSGYNEINYHSPQGTLGSDCPVDYYATSKWDIYWVGTVMPTFHFSAETAGGLDGVTFLYPHNADFSNNSDISGLAMAYGAGPAPFIPFNVTLIGNDGYNQFESNVGTSGQGSGQSVTDAVITWYGLGGDDALHGGDHSVDLFYGGLGNDEFIVANNEDRVFENTDEGFDVVGIKSTAPNYRFDYPTSIEAIYLYPGASVDRSLLPESVIFLDYMLDNRGPGSYGIAEYLKGTPYNDALYGGGGDDTVVAEGGNDFVDAGPGNDKVDGAAGNDAISTGSGDDAVQAGDGNDLIIGGSGEGNDTYNGGNGIDTVKYTSAKDGIIVNLSAKTNQASSIAPGDAAKIGIDQIALVENVIAGNFNDQVIGSKLANTLDGEDGNDLLRGEKGNDILIGGRGSDTLIGGAGNEVFVYRAIEDSTPSAPDTIADFSVGKEKIDLSQIDASTALNGINTFMFNGYAPIGTSSEGEVSIVKVDNAGKANDYMMVYIDTDADPEPEAAIKLNKLLKLSLKNFVL